VIADVRIIHLGGIEEVAIQIVERAIARAIVRKLRVSMQVAANNPVLLPAERDAIAADAPRVGGLIWMGILPRRGRTGLDGVRCGQLGGRAFGLDAGRKTSRSLYLTAGQTRLSDGHTMWARPPRRASAALMLLRPTLDGIVTAGAQRSPSR
jgi:hypothetical protein